MPEIADRSLAMLAAALEKEEFGRDFLCQGLQGIPKRAWEGRFPYLCGRGCTHRPNQANIRSRLCRTTMV